MAEFAVQGFDTPVTNNQAERDVCMIKVQQKISGNWRSPTGDEAFTLVRSSIATQTAISGANVAGMLDRVRELAPQAAILVIDAYNA